MRLFEPRQFSRENVGLSIQRLGVRVHCGERDTVFTKLEAGKRTLSWPMRSRKNHSEPKNYRSPKNLGKRSLKIYQQETKWHASDRAPLAQSGESWTFNPTVKSSSRLWGKISRFHKTWSRKKWKLWVDQCNPERVTESRKSIGLQKTCETIQTNSTKQCDMRLFEPRQFSRENVGLSIQRLGVRVHCGERGTVLTKLEAGKYKNFELTNAIQKKPQWAAKLQES